MKLHHYGAWFDFRASSQAVASSHRVWVYPQYRGCTHSLWELATACDEAGTGLHMTVRAKLGAGLPRHMAG